MALGDLRRLGFNTAGDWSDEHAASAGGVPYCRPLERYWQYRHTPRCAGSFPDVYHPHLAADIREDADAALRDTVNDPAMLGYFLDNEPGWHGHAAGPAAAMLYETADCYSRRALAGWLRSRYGTGRALRTAWGMTASVAAVARGVWSEPLTPAATRDLAAFSTVMIRKLCETLSAACRRVDANHLNLGVRWWTFPPLYALRAMRCFDVVSFNYYLPKVDMIGYGAEREPGVEEEVARLQRPFMVGEWHFGAFDGGLPGAGLSAVKDQAERGKVFRVYLEHAAALPWLVGAHWFNMYDRPALYATVNGENANIGFFDIAHAPHRPICDAARRTHARMYELAAGRLAPYDAPVEFVFPSR